MDIQLELGASGGELLAQLKQMRSELAEQQKQVESLAKANKQATQETVSASDEWIQKQKELLSIQKQQEQRLSEQSKLIKELRAQYDDLKKSASGSLDSKAADAYKRQIQELKREIQELKNSMSDKGKKLEIFAPGSVEEARATVARLKAELASLDAQQRKSQTGKFLAGELKVATAELKKAEIQAGLTTQANNALSKSWSVLRQAAYILPGIGVAGIITALTGAISDLVSKIFDFGKSMKSMNEIIAESGGKYKEAVTNINLLKSEVDAAKQGLISKDGVVKHYNETLGKTIGLAENLNEVEQKLTENAEAYIKYTYLKAVANLALEESAKSAFEAEKIRQKQLDEFISTADKIGTGLSGGFGLDPLTAAKYSRIASDAEVANAENEKNKLIKIEEDKASKFKNIYDKFFDDAAKLAKEKGWNYFDDTKETTEKRLREFKDRSDKIIALEKQLAEARVAAMSEGREKAIAEENARYDALINQSVNNVRKYEDEIDKIRKDPKISNENKKKEVEQLTQIIELEYKNREQAELTHTAKMLAIDMKYYDDARKAYEESQASINDVILKDQDKELAQLEKKYKDLIKKLEDARKKALAAVSDPIVQAGINYDFENDIAALTEAQQKERNDIIKKWNLKNLQEQEKFALAEAGLLQKDGAKAVDIERMRQIARLNVQIDFAKKRIDLLQGSTEKEDRLMVAELKAQIEKYETEIQKLSEKSKGKNDIYSLLGLKLDEKEKKDFEQGIRAMTDSVLEIWKSYVDQRVSEQEKIIDSLQKEISEQEKYVDEQKALAEKGLANNLDIAQRELDDMKRRNNEQVTELKRLQKEQMAYAKAQQIIQGIVTATKLGAAAAEYFAGGSAYGPIVGVALAVAAVATMVATFATLKQQTKQLSDYQTYRDGGSFDARRADMPTHEQGGIDVVDSRSGRKLAEFEKNEYAYFFKDGAAAKKYENFFDDVNEGKGNRWVVTPTGMLLPERTLKQVVVNNYHSDGSEKYLKKIAGNVDKIANSETVEYVPGYKIIRKGNLIRKIKNG